MNSNSWFKLVASILDWIKSSLFAFPFAYALIHLVAFKQNKFAYGYDFFELNHKAAIIIAISIGVVLSAWNAMAFAEAGTFEPKQYLKPTQKYRLKNTAGINFSDMKNRIQEVLKEHPKWIYNEDANPSEIRIEIRNIIKPRDVVKLNRDNSGWIITSRPKWRIYFVDMARNLKHVQYISSKIQKQA